MGVAFILFSSRFSSSRRRIELELHLQPEHRVAFRHLAPLVSNGLLQLGVPPHVAGASDLLLHVLVQRHHLVVVELHLLQQLVLHSFLLLVMEIDLIFWKPCGVEVLVLCYDFVI